jgi:coenzyme F420 hydrogenase subunit beta
MEDKTCKGQKELLAEVSLARLCTGCGACVNLCPYQRSYEDKIISLFDCIIEKGRCYAFCPRTPVVGAIKGFFIARAADKSARENAQHGGTVTALMALALKEGLIDTAVMADKGESFLPAGVAETDSRK